MPASWIGVVPVVSGVGATEPLRRVPRTSVWAEDASVVLGVVGAVCTMATAVGVAWFLFWGVSLRSDTGLGLLAATDVTLILLSVLFHQLSLELARPDSF